MSPASSPESPTEYGPCRLIDATISRLTLPTSAMRTMSMVSSSVTRRPVDELGFLAELAHQRADLRTAAVHHDRVHADQLHEHDIGGEEIGERRVLHRVAAVLDDDGAPENSRMYGRASARTIAFSPASLTRSSSVVTLGSPAVLVDVRVREVGGEDRRLAVARGAGRSGSRCRGRPSRGRARPRRARTRCRRGTR